MVFGSHFGWITLFPFQPLKKFIEAVLDSSTACSATDSWSRSCRQWSRSDQSAAGSPAGTPSNAASAGTSR